MKKKLHKQIKEHFDCFRPCLTIIKYLLEKQMHFSKIAIKIANNTFLQEEMLKFRHQMLEFDELKNNNHQG